MVHHNPFESQGQAGLKSEIGKRERLQYDYPRRMATPCEIHSNCFHNSNVELPRHSSFGISHPAFSLVELIVAISLIVVMAAVAKPYLVSFSVNDRVRRSAQRVAGDLRLAQSEAIKQQSTTSLTYYPDDDAYTVDDMSPDAQGATDRKVLLGADASYRTALVSVSFGGNSDLSFDAFGVPSSGGSITVGLNHMRCTITVEPATGRVVIGDLTRQTTAIAPPVVKKESDVLTKKEKGLQAI